MSQTELKTFSNLHSFCFEDSAQASSYVATQVTARFIDTERNIEEASVTEVEIVKRNSTLSESRKVQEGETESFLTGRQVM